MIEKCHLVVDDQTTIIITTDHLLIMEETRRIEEDHLDHHRMPMDGNPAEVLVRIVIVFAWGEIIIMIIIVPVEEERTGAVMIDADITVKTMKFNNWDAAWRCSNENLPNDPTIML
jgi:hypothetical protein